MELVDWDGYSVGSWSPGKARLYSTVLFSCLQLIPPTVGVLRRIHSQMSRWISGPKADEENTDLRTPIASVDDLRALNEEMSGKPEWRKRRYRTGDELDDPWWTIWDTCDISVILFQLIADTTLINASFQLQHGEIIMANIMQELSSSGQSGSTVANNTSYFFQVREHHHVILHASHKWIFTSFAFDVLHFTFYIAKIITEHRRKKKVITKRASQQLPQGVLATNKLVAWYWNFPWTIILRSSLMFSLASIASNSLWYSIFITTPPFQPKGLTGLAMNLFNSI